MHQVVIHVILRDLDQKKQGSLTHEKLFTLVLNMKEKLLITVVMVHLTLDMS